MKRNSSVLLAMFATLFVGVVCAQDKSPASEELPPVPFIIGGDEVVSPSEGTAGPLVLPEEPTLPAAAAKASEPAPAKPLASTAGDLEDVPFVPGAVPMANEEPVVAPITTPVPAVTEVARVEPAVAPVVTEPVVATPIVLPEMTTTVAPAKEVAVSAAPAVVTSNDGRISLTPASKAEPLPVTALAPTKPTDFGPSYELLTPPEVVTGVDGSTHIKTLEHVVGRSSALPAVERISPLIAEVGTEFPELHVDKIPLEDLLAYLKDYTPKALVYALPEPVYVTVDMKAKNVEEVLEYIRAHYPVEIASVADRLIVQPAGTLAARTPVAAPVAFAPAPMPVGVSGQYKSLLPDIVQPVAGAGTMTLPAGPVTGVVPPVETPEAPTTVASAAVDDSYWKQMRSKARLYELAKQREDLMKQRDGIIRTIRDEKLTRRFD